MTTVDDIQCPASSLCEWRTSDDQRGLAFPLSRLRAHLIERHAYPPLEATGKAIDIFREAIR